MGLFSYIIPVVIFDFKNYAIIRYFLLMICSFLTAVVLDFCLITYQCICCW